MDRSFTLAELGCHERSRQSLIFGVPAQIIPCPMEFQLAVFLPGQTFGYERWKANAHGTVSWQFLVLKTRSKGQTNRVPGIYPGADILFQARGKDAARRALGWVKSIRKKNRAALETVPEVSWRRMAGQRLLRADFPNPSSFIARESQC